MSKKWNVWVPYYANVMVEVEAKNAKEAKEKGAKEAWPNICNHCANHIEIEEQSDAEVTAEEIK